MKLKPIFILICIVAVLFFLKLYLNYRTNTAILEKVTKIPYSATLTKGNISAKLPSDNWRFVEDKNIIHEYLSSNPTIAIFNVDKFAACIIYLRTINPESYNFDYYIDKIKKNKNHKIIDISRTEDSVLIFYDKISFFDIRREFEFHQKLPDNQELTVFMNHIISSDNKNIEDEMYFILNNLFYSS